MSFARYIAGDVLLFLFCAITLPLWLPSWLWFSFRSWLDLQRFYWRCEETMRKNAERNAGVAPSHGGEHA